MPAISGKATIGSSETLLSAIIGAVTVNYLAVRSSKGTVYMGDAGSVSVANGFTLPIEDPLEINTAVAAADVAFIGGGVVEVFAIIP